jgi:hypothetical protein
MPTAPSLERDSAAGRRTSGNEALDRFQPQPLSARAAAGSLVFDPASLSFAIHPHRPHNARTRACAYWWRNMSFARPITRAPDQSTTLRVARSRAKRSAADWQGAHRVFLFLLTGAASTLPVSRLGSGPMVSMTAGWMLFPLPRGSLNPCVRGRDSATAQGRARASRSSHREGTAHPGGHDRCLDRRSISARSP